MPNNTQKPIALTSGEPAGIASEITAKAWHALRDELTFFLIGDINTLAPWGNYQEIAHPKDAHKIMNNALPVLHRPFPVSPILGIANPKNAQTIIDNIRYGVELIYKGQASSLCTNPIQKKTLYQGANFPFPGHTEFLAHLSKSREFVMMLAGGKLRVVPTTIHIPLREVANKLSLTLIETTIKITRDALINNFTIPNPIIGVAGLNPHAGEGGKIGHEEEQIIAPLLEKLRKQNWRIKGPLSADTLFNPDTHKKFDAIICMYHDQALIPFKAFHFADGVNITLGLDFIRTSPDHGTALDIAGHHKANPTSLIEALRMAKALSTSSNTSFSSSSFYASKSDERA